MRAAHPLGPGVAGLSLAKTHAQPDSAPNWRVFCFPQHRGLRDGESVAMLPNAIRSASAGTPLRVRDEFALHGHDVAESTVAKYMVEAQDSKRQRTWRTFLRNRLDLGAGRDLFNAPTPTFRLLCVFVALSHDRRRILHLNVTQHPTAEWTAPRPVVTNTTMPPLTLLMEAMKRRAARAVDASR